MVYSTKFKIEKKYFIKDIQLFSVMVLFHYIHCIYNVYDYKWVKLVAFVYLC